MTRPQEHQELIRPLTSNSCRGKKQEGIEQELSGVEGLVRSDLGDLKWSEPDCCYVCTSDVDPAALPDLIASVGEEVEKIINDLYEEGESFF